ncbi:MAG: T9SS type A sorting domain-containing protein [Bacteroidota bacterium]
MNLIHLRLLALTAFFSLFSFSLLQAQCVIDTLVPNVPGIYPDTFPPAEGCEFYSQDVTFFFPKDTTLDVFGNPFTAPFESFHITGIAGLPLGMDWECNTDSCFYDLSAGNPVPDTLGCVRFFGTPTIPATYPIVVYINARVKVLNNIIEQQATYETSIVVEPCEFIGSCYTYTVSSNCQPAQLDISNNVPSGGKDGFSYNWQVQGPNGFSYQTSDENPFPQSLNDAGTYTISYSATVDTIGFILDSVVIEKIGCEDFLDAADLYWKLFDPSQNEIVNTSNNVLSNIGDNLPLNTGIGPLFLDTGLYEFQVFDQDNLIADEGCADGMTGGSGSVFVNIPPVSSGPVTIVSDSLIVTFYINNPISVIACQDTFQLDSLPLMPAIAADTNRVCQGDTAWLMTSSSDSIQWYRNGLPLLNAHDPMYPATLDGFYTVEVISRASLCSATSQGFTVEIFSVQAPSIAFDGLNMSIASPDPALRYDWYNDDDVYVGSGTPFALPASDSYYAVAVDTATGCQSGPSATILSVLTPLEDELGEITLEVYPNPTAGQVKLRWEAAAAGELSLRLTDMMGRSLFQEDLGRVAANGQTSYQWQDLPAGIYLLMLNWEGRSFTQKLLIEK